MAYIVAAALLLQGVDLGLSFWHGGDDNSFSPYSHMTVFVGVLACFLSAHYAVQNASAERSERQKAAAKNHSLAADENLQLGLSEKPRQAARPYRFNQEIDQCARNRDVE